MSCAGRIGELCQGNKAARFVYNRSSSLPLLVEISLIAPRYSTMPTVALAIALLSAHPVQAACEVRSSTADLAAALNAAAAAMVAMDFPGFVENRNRAQDALHCLGERLTAVDVAAFHRVMALDAYLDQDPEGTVASFRSALATQPGFTLPASFALPGNPLHDLFQQAREQGAGASNAIFPPAGTVIFVDSLLGTSRPVERPAILELQAADGSLLWTGYLPTGAENPDWTQLELQIPTAPGHLSGVKLSTVGPSVPLLVAAGGTALAAGGLYAVAYGMSRSYRDPENPDIEEPAGHS